jgi:hypothetical protein
VIVTDEVPVPHRRDEAPRIHIPVTQLAPRRGAVFEVNPVLLGQGALQRLHVFRGPRIDLDTDAGAVTFETGAQRTPQLRERALERIGSLHPGELGYRRRARIKSEGLGRRETERSGEVVGHPHVDPVVVEEDVDEVSGPVTRKPAQEDEIEVVEDLALTNVEFLRQLIDRHARVLDRVRKEEEDPAQSATEATAGVRAHAGVNRSTWRAICARTSGGATTST